MIIRTNGLFIFDLCCNVLSLSYATVFIQSVKIAKSPYHPAGYTFIFIPSATLLYLIFSGYRAGTLGWVQTKRVCPAFKNFAHTIRFVVILMSQSASTIVGLFPPSSRVTGVRCFAAA